MVAPHKFTITVEGVAVFATDGKSRMEALRRAIRYAAEYVEAGFPSVAIDGVTSDDWKTLDMFGWPRPVAH